MCFFIVLVFPFQQRFVSPALCYRPPFSKAGYKTGIEQHRNVRLNAIFCAQLSEIFYENTQKRLRKLRIFSALTPDARRSLKTSPEGVLLS